MTRIKAEPTTPPSISLPSQIWSADDLKLWTDDVRAWWVQAAKRGPALPTPEQIESLAWHMLSCVVRPIDHEKMKLDAEARAAMKMLLKWCRYDPDQTGLPHLVFRDQSLGALEASILAAWSLAEAQDRPWVTRAWSIWRMVSLIKCDGDESGIGAGSHTVGFTSLALRAVGYQTATPDAVSAELRTNPDFRKRLLK